MRELEALYARDFQTYVRVARAITGDRERAVEAVQDGFARAIDSRHSFRGDGPVGAWVWQIVVNAARSAARTPVVEDTMAGVPEINGAISRTLAGSDSVVGTANAGSVRCRMTVPDPRSASSRITATRLS